MAGSKIAEAFIGLNVDGVTKVSNDLKTVESQFNKSMNSMNSNVLSVGNTMSTKFRQAMLQTSYGVQDFLAVYGTMGLQGALRASINNLGMVATIVQGPVTGGLMAMGLAIGSVLIENLVGGRKKTDEFRGSVDALVQSFKNAKSASEFGAALRKAADVSDVTDAAKANAEIVEGKKNIAELNIQIDDAFKQREKAKALAAAGAVGLGSASMSAEEKSAVALTLKYDDIIAKRKSGFKLSMDENKFLNEVEADGARKLRDADRLRKQVEYRASKVGVTDPETGAFTPGTFDPRTGIIFRNKTKEERKAAAAEAQERSKEFDRLTQARTAMAARMEALERRKSGIPDPLSPEKRAEAVKAEVEALTTERSKIEDEATAAAERTKTARRRLGEREAYSRIIPFPKSKREELEGDVKAAEENEKRLKDKKDSLNARILGLTTGKELPAAETTPGKPLRNSFVDAMKDQIKPAFAPFRKILDELEERKRVIKENVTLSDKDRKEQLELAEKAANAQIKRLRPKGGAGVTDLIGAGDAAQMALLKTDTEGAIKDTEKWSHSSLTELQNINEKLGKMTSGWGP